MPASRRRYWFVRHLPDLVLFCVTTPIAVVALLLHW